MWFQYMNIKCSYDPKYVACPTGVLPQIFILKFGKIDVKSPQMLLIVIKTLMSVGFSNVRQVTGASVSISFGLIIYHGFCSHEILNNAFFQVFITSIFVLNDQIFMKIDNYTNIHPSSTNIVFHQF